jgi:hypothetical protein
LPTPPNNGTQKSLYDKIEEIASADIIDWGYRLAILRHWQECGITVAAFREPALMAQSRRFGRHAARQVPAFSLDMPYGSLHLEFGQTA